MVKESYTEHCFFLCSMDDLECYVKPQHYIRNVFSYLCNIFVLTIRSSG